MDQKCKSDVFVYCSPTTLIERIHLNRPYFELPLAAKRLGLKPILFIGKINFNYGGPIDVVESGYYNHKWFKRFYLLIVLLRFIRKEKPKTFIFFHMEISLPLVVLACKVFNYKNKTKFWLKLDWGGNNIPEFGNFMFLRNVLLSFQSYFVNNIIIENTCGYHALRKIPHINTKRIRLIPNSYSSQFDNFKTEEVTKRRPEILVVSRVSREKGLEDLFSAFSIIKSEFPDWSIKIVGPIENNEYFNLLKHLIESLNIENKVSFNGPRYGMEIVRLMHEASIFCLPSLAESFGISRLEAMASGLPVVTSNAGCGEDFEKMGCFVYEVGDIAKLSSYLRTLMGDQQLRAQVSKKQRQNLQSYDEIIRKILSLEE